MPSAAGEVPLALAFGAGLVATVNPCGFAMLPPFIAYYLGEGGSGQSGPGRITDGLVVGLVVTAGFMVVFAFAGTVLALGAREMVKVIPWFTIAMGVAIMALGLWLLAGRHLVIRVPGMRAPSGPGYRSMFVFGIAYAVGSLSCTLPIFLTVIGSATSAGSVVGMAGVFSAYGLGVATILMLLCVGTAGFREVLARALRPLMRHIDRISGVLLLLGGGYVVFYWASLLSGSYDSAPVRFVQDVQQRAQELITGTDDRVWIALGSALVAGAALLVMLRWTQRERQAKAESIAREKTGDQPQPSLESEQRA